MLKQIKLTRAQGGEVKTLAGQYREIGLKAKKRLRHVVRVRAEKVIEQVEQLKAGDAKASWRALKNLIHGHGVKSTLNTVLDREGKEVACAEHGDGAHTARGFGWQVWYERAGGSDQETQGRQSIGRR